MADIVITFDGGEGSFHLPDDAVCPRVGERFHYYFTASQQDREQFAGDSLRHNDKLHGGVWKVVRIEHHLDKSAWNKQRCTTWVTVKPIKRARTQSASTKEE